MRTVCFSHGKESGPWGTKIRSLADIAQNEGWAVESLDYQGMDDAAQRVALLQDWCSLATTPFVLVGSSMGGHVAAAAANSCQPLGLFLLAPAFYMPGYEAYTPTAPGCPITIVHGWHDDIIPWQNSTRYGAEASARVILLDSDHRLVDVLPELGEEFTLFLRLLLKE